MDHAYRQMKPAGLLMLLLTSLWGCSALPPGLSQVKIPGSVQEATKDFNEWMSKKFPGGQVRNVDRYCDAHEEPSYAVTDNVLGIMLSQGSQIVQSAAKTNFKSLSLSKMDLEKMAKNISKKNGQEHIERVLVDAGQRRANPR